MTNGCPCGAGWRIEAAALGSGAIMASLPVLSFDAQNLLNDVGTGTFTLQPGDIANLRHVWPHMTSLWVTYYDQFVWAGMIEGLSLQAGTLSLGCVSLEGYLAKRTIRETLTYSGEDQNSIAAQLVEYQRTRYGIPLYGAYIPSAHSRDRTYAAVDRLNLMDQITALTQLTSGSDWRLNAVRSEGRWVATMTFADNWGIETDITLVSDVEAPDYGLEIKTDDHATFVDAMGSGLIGTATKPPYPVGDSPYVEFDAAPSFSDVTVQGTLDQQAAGYLKKNKEPFVNPRIVLSGRESTQGLGIVLGDVVEARMCFSGLSYQGPSRVVGETWSAAPDLATTRELLLTPNGRPSQTLLDQDPCVPCLDC